MKKISRTILGVMAFAVMFTSVALTFASEAPADAYTSTSSGSSYDATPYYVLAGFATLAAYEAFIAAGKKKSNS